MSEYRYSEVFEYFAQSKENQMDKKDIKNAVIALGGDPLLLSENSIPEKITFDNFKSLMNEINININDLPKKLQTILEMLDENSSGTVQVSIIEQILESEGMDTSKIKKIIEAAPKRSENEIIINDFINDLLMEID